MYIEFYKIDMKTYKVKIFPNNEDFYSELIEYLLQKSSVFKREFYIDNILNQHVSSGDIFKKLSPVETSEIYGSTFQSNYRDNEPSYISHTIHSIGIDGDKFFANIELWRIKYNELMILRPVYYKSKETNKYKIGTFDIDYDITHDKAA